HVAIGLSAGDPVTDKTEIFEEAIQFAKRLCCIARKDQVVISSLVRDNYKREGVENLS
ncbi:MAG: hypothetical protein GWN16_06850, partial [Calditrichae bacterium]|nr:hypothetical protein [Calditrichia bacterium]